jgi:hypothetical protein
LYQIEAQNWSFVVLNSVAKVNKNEVITFERPKSAQTPVWAFTARATKSMGATTKSVTAMPLEIFSYGAIFLS